MALEVATTINQLDPANPTSVDPKSQGDDHLRLLKSVLKATFPNVTGVVNASHTELSYLAGALGPMQTGGDLRNLIVNGNFAINQRVYGSGQPTTVANQVTLDRWRVVTSGQTITFGPGFPDRVVNCPLGGLEQIVEGEWVAPGVYTLSWVGTATAKVNGAAIANGGSTGALPGNTIINVQFASGTVSRAQLEAGTIATPFQRRPPGVEMMLCLRDFAKTYAMGTFPGTVAAVGAYTATGNVANTIDANIRFSVPMKFAPVIALWDTNANPNATSSYSAAGVLTSRGAAAANSNEFGFLLRVGAASTDVVVSGHWTASTLL
jgi:hypothetical protein